MMLGPYELDQIYTGDARELAKVIPDESVDLIFTDPPYPKQFEAAFSVLASTARALKVGGTLMTLAGHYQLEMAMRELGSVLTYDWIIAQMGGGQHCGNVSKARVGLLEAMSCIS